MLKRRKRTQDLILDNKYNRGEYDFEQLPNVKILEQFQNLEVYHSSYEYYRNESLNESLSLIWDDTEWKKYYKHNKKIPKDQLSELYTFFKKNFDDSTYTNIELFIGIADFLDVNYKNLYDMTSTLFKQELLEELNNKYNIINENKIYKLF